MDKAKKPFTAPRLVEYGKMEQLTRGPWGGSLDSIIGQAIGIGSVSGGLGGLESWHTHSR